MPPDAHASLWGPFADEVTNLAEDEDPPVRPQWATASNSARARALAICMAGHDRLGESSPLRVREIRSEDWGVRGVEGENEEGRDRETKGFVGRRVGCG